MEDTLESSFFFITAQASLVLGLIHGVNPCGHSWVVLAPFVAGGKDGKNVAVLTAAFLAGTALACLVLGATLGALAAQIPMALRESMEWVVALIIIGLGLSLFINPHFLHSHCDHGSTGQKLSAAGLFGIGFVNMILPCPTAAIMYTYAINSGDPVTSTAIFGIYALATAISVSAVIYAIHKVTGLARKLDQHWVEHAIMRGVGFLTVIFGAYMLIADH